MYFIRLLPPYSSSWQAVTAIHNHIQARGVRAGIARQVKVCALELAGLTLATVEMQILAIGDFAHERPLSTYPMTILPFQIFFVSGEQKVEISVRMYPGDTVLTRANPVHSTAKLLPMKYSCQSSPSSNPGLTTYKSESRRPWSCYTQPAAAGC